MLSKGDNTMSYNNPGEKYKFPKEFKQKSFGENITNSANGLKHIANFIVTAIFYGGIFLLLFTAMISMWPIILGLVAVSLIWAAIMSASNTPKDETKDETNDNNGE